MPFRTALSADDPERVASLVRRCSVFNGRETEVARSLVEEALARGDAAGYEFLFSDSNDGIDAYTCFGPIPGTRERYELYWIAVDPAVQKRGLGRALLAATERAAASRGASRLFAETSGLPVYAPAHALYDHAGYRLVASIPDYHAEGDPLLIFGKRL